MKDEARRILYALVALLSLIAFNNSASAQLDAEELWNNGVTEPWRFAGTLPPAEITAAQLRWKLIENEEGSENSNEWAGDYFIGGDTHGTYLRLSPNNSFVMMNVNKCSAYVEGFSYGQVKIASTLIQLLTEKQFTSSGSHSHTRLQSPLKFLPVKWRGAHYLVEEDEVSEFGDYVAGLGQYNPGQDSIFIDGINFFYKPSDKETGSADDLPSVPPSYEKFLKRPINARVTSVGARVVKRRQTAPDDEPYYESETTVTINTGSADGVKPGIALHVLSPGASDIVKVLRVRNRSSIGVITRYVEEETNKHFSLWKDSEGMNYSPITTNIELSTSVHKLVAVRNPE